MTIYRWENYGGWGWITVHGHRASKGCHCRACLLSCCATWPRMKLHLENFCFAKSGFPPTQHRLRTKRKEGRLTGTAISCFLCSWKMPEKSQGPGDLQLTLMWPGLQIATGEIGAQNLICLWWWLVLVGARKILGINTLKSLGKLQGANLLSWD